VLDVIPNAACKYFNGAIVEAHVTKEEQDRVSIEVQRAREALDRLIEIDAPRALEWGDCVATAMVAEVGREHSSEVVRESRGGVAEPTTLRLGSPREPSVSPSPKNGSGGHRKRPLIG